MLAISESSASPLAGIADQMLEVSTESPSFYNSFTPLTCILEAVAALVAVRAGDRSVATLEAGGDGAGEADDLLDARRRTPTDQDHEAQAEADVRPPAFRRLERTRSRPHARFVPLEAVIASAAPYCRNRG